MTTTGFESILLGAVLAGVGWTLKLLHQLDTRLTSIETICRIKNDCIQKRP